MATKTVPVVLFALILMTGTAFPRTKADAPEFGKRTKQMRALANRAAKAEDYQVLASYFHSQELLFRVRAQKTLDEYAQQVRRFPRATKVLTRAEVMARLRDCYVQKAQGNGRLAAQYEARLLALGIQPVRESNTTVSIKRLLCGSDRQY